MSFSSQSPRSEARIFISAQHRSSTYTEHSLESATYRRTHQVIEIGEGSLPLLQIFHHPSHERTTIRSCNPGKEREKRSIYLRARGLHRLKYIRRKLGERNECSDSQHPA